MDARSDEGDAVGQVRDEVTRRKKMEALLRSSRIMASTRETRDLCCRWPATFSTSCSARGPRDTSAKNISPDDCHRSTSAPPRIICRKDFDRKPHLGSHHSPAGFDICGEHTSIIPISIHQIHHHSPVHHCSTFDVNFNSTPPYPVVLRPLKHPTPTQIRMKWKRG